MPYDQFLGEFEAVKNSPQFDDVVTAENCYYYLSLLESFYELEQSMSPELFKRYIVVAEKRYLHFLLHSNDWYGESEALPLDIAYAWHAHLLSPVRYYEDYSSGKNNYRLYLPFQSRFPLKQMHEQRIKRSLGQEIGPLNWPLRFPVYPWVLDVDELQHTTFDPKARYHLDTSGFNSKESAKRFIYERFALYINCASCKERIFLQSWKEYAEFRTNPNVSIHCPSLLCKNPDNTVNSNAVTELLEAMPHKVKGTMLDNTGRCHIDSSEVKRQQGNIREYFDSVIKLQKEKLHCIKDVHDILSDHCSRFDIPNQPRLDEKHARRPYAREFIDIIRSTYEGNPTELSLDLVQAMHRQREFIRTMVTEITPTWANPLELEIPNAIRDYHDFLLLIKNQQNSTPIIPTWSVDIVWHVHMLHIQNYIRMGYNQLKLNRILNHDDVIAPFELNEHFAVTEKAWKSAYPSLVGLNLLSMTKQSIHSWNPSMMQNAYVYKELQKTMINYHTRRRLEARGVTFTRPQDLSYHGLDIIHQENQALARSSKNKPFDTYREIFKGIECTGYGYIGSSICIPENWSPSDISKRIEATLLPPEIHRFVRQWHKRWVGRIMPGTEITLFTSRNTGFSTRRKGSKFGIDSRFQWWIPRYELYGLMRRKYSKKHRDWGWTTDGFDWYSESECNFVLPSNGEFIGATFRETQQSSDNLNSGVDTGFSIFQASSGFGDGNYDNGGSSSGGGGDTGGYSGGSNGGGGGGDSGI